MAQLVGHCPAQQKVMGSFPVVRTRTWAAGSVPSQDTMRGNWQPAAISLSDGLSLRSLSLSLLTFPPLYKQVSKI